MRPDIVAALPIVADFIDGRCGLEALYVYGSHAKGNPRPDSDIDLAVLVRRLPDAQERAGLAIECERLAGQAVDLVFLNDASPVLARQVLAYGTLVRGLGSQRRLAFEASLPSRYADLRRAR